MLSYCRRARMSRLRGCPSQLLQSAQQLFPCTVSDESARPDLETEGIIEHNHHPPRTPEPLKRRLDADLSCPAGMPKTQLPSIAQTLLCLASEKEMKIVMASLDARSSSTTAVARSRLVFFSSRCVCKAGDDFALKRMRAATTSCGTGTGAGGRLISSVACPCVRALWIPRDL